MIFFKLKVSFFLELYMMQNYKILQEIFHFILKNAQTNLDSLQEKIINYTQVLGSKNNF